MDAELLPWIWLVAGVVLLVGEILTAGFFLLPFSIGALVASILGFVGVDPAWQVLAAFVTSAASFAALRPLAKRLDRSGLTEGIGSRRLIGASGTVLADIPPADSGMVRIEREEWRAAGVDDQPIPAGTRIRVIEVEGTRVLVQPFEAPVPDLPPGRPPPG
jgi:membrane protein implicated in regulation of membrane protease activity